MEIRVYAVKNKNEGFIKSYKHDIPPRLGEYFSFSYWYLKVIKVEWDVYEQEVIGNVYVDGSEIDDETWSRL